MPSATVPDSYKFTDRKKSHVVLLQYREELALACSSQEPVALLPRDETEISSGLGNSGCLLFFRDTCWPTLIDKFSISIDLGGN